MKHDPNIFQAEKAQIFLLNMTQIFFIYKKKYFSSQMHQSGQNIFKLKLNQTFSIPKEQNIIYREMDRIFLSQYRLNIFRQN